MALSGPAIFLYKLVMKPKQLAVFVIKYEKGSNKNIVQTTI